MTSKSGIRTPKKIEAHNCPILCTCGHQAHEEPEPWRFCGWFVGSQDVSADLLLVRCNCPAQLLVEGEA